MSKRGTTFYENAELASDNINILQAQTPFYCSSRVKLRRHLDDPILVKTSIGMVPTPRAQALLEPVTDLLRGAERIIRIPEEFSPASSQRRFVIATSDYVECTLLPKLTESINVRSPNIEIHIRPLLNKLLKPTIEEDDIDLIIGFNAIFDIPSHICHQKLFDDKLFAS